MLDNEIKVEMSLGVLSWISCCLDLEAKLELGRRKWRWKRDLKLGGRNLQNDRRRQKEVLWQKNGKRDGIRMLA